MSLSDFHIFLFFNVFFRGGGRNLLVSMKFHDVVIWRYKNSVKDTNRSIQTRSRTPGGQIEHRCTKVDAPCPSQEKIRTRRTGINFCAPVLDLTTRCCRSCLNWPIGGFEYFGKSPRISFLRFWFRPPKNHENKKIASEKYSERIM